MWELDTAHITGLIGGGNVDGSPTLLGLQKNLPEILFTSQSSTSLKFLNSNKMKMQS